MNLRTLSIELSAIVLLGTISFVTYTASPSGFAGILYASPVFSWFYGFPPIVSMVLSYRSKSPISQMILAGTSLLYGVWFTCIMYHEFYIAPPDAQRGLIILFVGIYALPVLLPLWIIAYFVEWRSRKKDQPAELQNQPVELRPGYGFAITSLTLGLLCVGTFLGLILGIIGIVFGILSLKTQGRKVGIVGLVLCIIMTIFHVLDTLMPGFGG